MWSISTTESQNLCQNGQFFGIPYISFKSLNVGTSNLARKLIMLPSAYWFTPEGTVFGIVSPCFFIFQDEWGNAFQICCVLQPWASCSHLCPSVTKQYNLVPAKGRWCCAAGEVTAGLVESSGSLPPGGWLMVTCGLTACTPGSALGPTLGIEYGKPLHSFYCCRMGEWSCTSWCRLPLFCVSLRSIVRHCQVLS